MLYGLLAGIVAQTCAVMLPSTALEFEWFRDGRPYAHDILIRTRSGERLYQRRYASGETAERVVSCTRTGRAIYFTDRVGSAAPARIPDSSFHIHTRWQSLPSTCAASRTSPWR